LVEGASFYVSFLQVVPHPQFPSTVEPDPVFFKWATFELVPWPLGSASNDGFLTSHVPSCRNPVFIDLFPPSASWSHLPCVDSEFPCGSSPLGTSFFFCSIVDLTRRTPPFLSTKDPLTVYLTRLNVFRRQRDPHWCPAECLSREVSPF